MTGTYIYWNTPTAGQYVATTHYVINEGWITWDSWSGQLIWTT